MPILELTTSVGHALTINARRESTVIMQNGDTSYTFDYEGRLIGAFIEGRNYRRSLANEILEKQSGPRPGLSGRLRRLLGREEVEKLEGNAYAFAGAAAVEVARTASVSGNAVEPRTLELVCEAFEHIESYSYNRLERERQTYSQIYHPVTILPPDQYLALYLQLTEGCAYNHCRFCGLYRDRHFHMKSLDEFRRHILDVRNLFGGGMSLRRSIFLGDANALMIPQMNLLPMFDAINAEFAILPQHLSAEARDEWEKEHPIHFNGIYSFVDAVESHRRSPRHYAELAARGLRRVYVGLESGDPHLLRFLGKPNTPRDVYELVNDVKAGGLAVGIILLIGAGGKRYEDAHIYETARLINGMPLDEGDLIYFSEVVDYPGSSYSERATAAGIMPLTVGEIEHQMVRLRSTLSFKDPDRAPKVSFYDIREFVY